MESVRYAIQTALQRGWTNVCIESDCQRLINLINSKQRLFNEEGLILEDIFALIPLFSLCTFTFIKRCGNDVAHRLAHYDFGLGEQIWEGGVPSAIEPFVLHQFSE